MNLLLPPFSFSSTYPKPFPHSLSYIPQALSSSSSSSSSFPIAVIIGGGLAGLAAATHLSSSNIPMLLLEASDAIGGRVRTDSLDGFLLDRGFQIFLTGYPEARRLLHYPSLHLHPFYPGALIYYDHRFHRVSDPFRRPLDGLASLSNPIGTLTDKLLIGLNRIRTAALPDAHILQAPETTISHLLASAGFSPSIVDRFFKPFLGGIFFDQELSTTSRLYHFIIKCLSLGDNSLPADGIAAIPNQLADRLPKGSLRLNSRAAAVDINGSSPKVKLESGEVLNAELGVIVAVEQPEAKKLIPTKLVTEKTPGRNRSTVCLYFSADRAAVKDPVLILNGSGEGIVNNMFFATNVAPSYGPKGKVLVSVSLIGAFDDRSDDDLTAQVVRELGRWFGDKEVGLWRHVRTYRIGFAQPDQTPPTDLTGKDPRVGDRVYLCGDYMNSATFDGALVSGRRAAEALMEDRSHLLTV